MAFRAQETAILFDGRGRGRDCGAETNVAPGAGIANQPVRVGPVRARWTLWFENDLGWAGVLTVGFKERLDEPGNSCS